MDFKEELKKVPEKPGVYLMHDASDKIIYVGKAIVLRNRLRSYFNNTPHVERITQMISHIDRFEFIVTGSEYEALLLECNLIKKHRPKYNVLLKDDRNYPYIKVTTNEEFPRVFMTHKPEKDGATYFGPYYLGLAVKSTLETLTQTFPLRSCKKTINPEKPQRVCLNYHIGLCPGPCAGYVSKEEYGKNVSSVCDILSGKSKEIIKKLENEMKDASENLDFEKAAILRDRIRGLEVISEKQNITLGNNDSFDVVAVYSGETDAVIQVFFVRGGKISGRDFYVLEGVGAMQQAELIVPFMEQFYETGVMIPGRIYVSDELQENDALLLSEMLGNLAERKVQIITPQRGEKKDIVEMAKENAKIALENYEITKRNEVGGNIKVLEKLQKILKLDRLPMRIESFDISNNGDSDIDGSMVVFTGGKPDKSQYKKYKIKTLDKRSDVGSMNEMLTRRYTRLKNGDKGFENAPDLILMDGGLQQVAEAENVLSNIGVTIPVFGMVKDNHHRSRGIVSKNTGEFDITTDPDIWRFITDVQNETHRFAITYNRKLTEKRYKKSPLDDIEGIGNTRKMALLKRFGSIRGIREADVSEIAKVSRIGDVLAAKIKEALS